MSNNPLFHVLNNKITLTNGLTYDKKNNKTSQADYYLIKLPTPSISDDSFTIVEHHISIYSTLDDKFSPYHYTAHLTDAEGDSYVVHVFFSINGILTSTPLLEKQEGTSRTMVKTTEEQNNQLIDWAIKSCEAPISDIKKQRALLIQQYNTDTEDSFKIIFNKNTTQTKQLELIETLIATSNNIQLFHDFPNIINDRINYLKQLKRALTSKSVTTNSSTTKEETDTSLVDSLESLKVNTQTPLKADNNKTTLQGFQESWEIFKKLDKLNLGDYKNLNTLADDILQFKTLITTSSQPVDFELMKAIYELEKAVFTYGTKTLQTVLFKTFQKDTYSHIFVTAINTDDANALSAFFPCTLTTKLLQMAIKTFNPPLVDYILSKKQCEFECTPDLVDFLVKTANDNKNHDDVIAFMDIFIKHNITLLEQHDKNGITFLENLCLIPAYTTWVTDTVKILSDLPHYLSLLIYKLSLSKRADEVTTLLMTEITKLQKNKTEYKKQDLGDFSKKLASFTIKIMATEDATRIKKIIVNSSRIQNIFTEMNFFQIENASNSNPHYIKTAKDNTMLGLQTFYDLLKEKMIKPSITDKKLEEAFFAFCTNIKESSRLSLQITDLKKLLTHSNGSKVIPSKNQKKLFAEISELVRDNENLLKKNEKIIGTLFTSKRAQSYLDRLKIYEDNFFGNCNYWMNQIGNTNNNNNDDDDEFKSLHFD